MISVTILTKNSARYLAQVLDALQGFDEVLLLDNGSTDDTLNIAGKYGNVSIRKAPFLGFGPLHNLASDLARHDWILSIDSDEVVCPNLAREILSTQLDENCLYSFERHTYYRGRLVKCCGWYPDRIVRLYHKKRTRFSDDVVHERILPNQLQEIPLAYPMRHYSYEKISDFLTKMQTYSELFATQWQGKKKATPFKAVLHAFFAFWKNYLFKRGIFCGYAGMLISSYIAHTTFYKYLKLYEADA